MSDEARRELLEMFLPELHQAWWAEALGKLRDKKHQTLDPEEKLAIDERIREHYKHRHETDSTRSRLSSKMYLRNRPNSPC